MSLSPWFSRVHLFVAPIIVLLAGHSSFADIPGQVTLGPTRFTAITPQCVRLEYATSGKFVDEPSYFAANRDAHLADAKITSDANGAVIDTGELKLTYKANGQPFDAENLTVEIKKGNQTVTWHPGDANTGNLGGTAGTLDGWDGARQLGDGVLSRDGWYLLDDSKTVLFTKDWVKSRPRGAGTDWYLFGYGDDYKAALKSLMTVSGNIPLPRRYCLGVWYSRYWPYTSTEFRQIVKEYADHDFPLDALVLDMDWHLDGWTGYTWNPKLLPDHQALLDWVHQQNLALTLNDHPADGVGKQEACYADFMKAMRKDPEKDKPLPFDAGDKKYLDTFYEYTHRPFEKQGVDFWWLDWQQYPFTRSIHDLTNLEWLNHYYFQQTGSDGKRGVCFSRWGGWGSRRYPIQFSGDASTAFRMLAFEVPFTATAGNVGCFFWSHDIGGHNRGRNEESYARWCQFGAFTAALRSHSTRDASMDRRPWTYPKWAEDSMKVSFQLRSKFFPYLYTAMKQACDSSIPFVRPMYIDNPTVEAAYHQPQEYQFGDNLLVAPITEPGVGPNRIGRQTVWFPPGQWYNYFTGEEFDGNQQILMADPINQFPLFVRGGVPIPMRQFTQRMATDPIKELVIRCYPGEAWQQNSTTLYEDDGTSTGYQSGKSASTRITYARKGLQIAVTVDPTQGNYAGQVDQRSYVIELPASWATDVTVDDSPVKVDPNGTDRISVPGRSIHRGLKITAKYSFVPGESQSVVRFDALFQRLGLPVPMIHGRLPGLDYPVRQALEKATGDDEKAAILAAAGVGVFGRNENVYGYPAKTTDQIFVPKDVDAKIEPTDAPIEPLAASQGPAYKASVAGLSFLEHGTPAPVDFSKLPGNIAADAKVTVSTGGPASALIDGKVDGYPGPRENEWTTTGEKAGAWAKLEWPAPQKIKSVVLFDRPNLNDQVTSGTIEFSDGSTETFDALPNDAAHGLEVKFNPRTISWLKITITGVAKKTENVGLAEVVVLKAD